MAKFSVYLNGHVFIMVFTVVLLMSFRWFNLLHVPYIQLLLSLTTVISKQKLGPFELIWLEFYGPVNANKVMSCQSVYQTTLLLGSFSLRPILVHIFCQKLTTALLESAVEERMIIENIS